jgi:hypothetical protein
MDSQGFRKTSREFARFEPSGDVQKQAKIEIEATTSSVPVEDSRYPAYAAPMSDGREFTDYRERCVTYAPPKYHNPVRHWMARNGDEIMRTARRRQAQNTGAVLGTADTEARFEKTQYCTPLGCTISTSDYTGVGIQTMNQTCPELFGTFEFPADPDVIWANRKNISLTTKSEGGVNTSERWKRF